MCKATDAASSRYPRRQDKRHRNSPNVPPLCRHPPGPPAGRDVPPIPEPQPASGPQGWGDRPPHPAGVTHPPLPCHNAASNLRMLLAKLKGNFGVILFYFILNVGSQRSKTERMGPLAPKAPVGQANPPKGFVFFGHTHPYDI